MGAGIPSVQIRDNQGSAGTSQKEPGKRERGGAERVTPPRSNTGSEETNECRHSKLTQQTKAKASQVVGNAAEETDARWRRRWNHRKTKLEDRRKETARKKGDKSKNRGRQ